MWKKLSFFVAVPGVALCMLNVYLGAMQEEHHQPPFVPYEHMRIRNKVIQNLKHIHEFYRLTSFLSQSILAIPMG